MKINLSTVCIRQNTMTIVVKTVWPWETPLYEFKFEGKIEVSDADPMEVSDDYELPDANAEFARMGNVFGSEGGENGQAWVHIAYGRGKAGIDALQKVIDGSVVKEKATKPDPKPEPEKKASVKKKTRVKKKVTKKKATKKAKDVDPLA